MATANLRRKNRQGLARGTEAGGKAGRANAAGPNTGEERQASATHGSKANGGGPVVWYQSTWFLALAGVLLLWAAFPPLGIWPLAWIAPVSWLALVAAPRLPGRRPYLVLWAVSLIHWLMVLQGIRLAHWATYFGWAALSLYLAVYLPMFVGLTRLAVHRLRWPMILAAPVIWTGLELARGYLLTGFSLALLGHTQVSVLPILQVADLFGAYGVSFLIMMFAAGVLDAGRKTRRLEISWPGLVGVLAVVAAATYGGLRIRAGEPATATERSHLTAGGEHAADEQQMALNVALLQRSAETIFEYDPQRNLDIFYDYRQLALEAASRHPDLDLIVWPESVYTANLREVLFDGPVQPPDGISMDDKEFQLRVRQWQLAFEAKNRDLAQSVRDAAESARPSMSPPQNDLPDRSRLPESSDPPAPVEPRGATSVESVPQSLGPALLVGTDVETIRQGRSHYYNTAMLLDSAGGVAGRYYKMHPVMFGEYVPLGGLIPWLYQLTPLSQGLSKGEAPQSFQVRGFRLSPNICFESTVPHLIRRHVVQLERQGQAPDVLVTITNDGWFRGSSILDLHLACSVFRAVEHRRPMLIAANTGISAWIDGSGRVCRRIEPLQDEFLVARIVRDPRHSWYTRIGDFAAMLCLLATGVVAVWGAIRSRKVAISRE